MSRVVGRFYVAQISEYAYSKGSREIKLQVVTQGKENAIWASATPAGQIVMTIRNPLAAEAFELGAEYLVAFERAGAAA